MSMRRAASCTQPLQCRWVPRGAVMTGASEALVMVDSGGTLQFPTARLEWRSRGLEDLEGGFQLGLHSRRALGPMDAAVAVQHPGEIEGQELFQTRSEEHTSELQ